MRQREAVCSGEDGLNRHKCQNQRYYELDEPSHLDSKSKLLSNYKPVIHITSSSIK